MPTMGSAQLGHPSWAHQNAILLGMKAQIRMNILKGNMANGGHSD
jgi:hypothetical protein